MYSLRRRGWRVGAAFVAGVSMAACTAEPSAPELLAAKGGAGGAAPKVSSAEPSVGEQGQHLLVRVFGSGFNPTAVAAWERNGEADPGITVNSTTYVSSTEVVADINIASDADTVLYDISVEVLLADGSRKKGVGIEKFEVQGNHAGGNQSPEVPYYFTIWGAIITNPSSDDPPVAGEQLAFAWAIQTDTVQLGTRHDAEHVGSAWTAFVSTKANANLTVCKKGNKQLSNAESLALLEYFVKAGAVAPQGASVWIDSPAITTGTGSGRVGMYYVESDPASPFYLSEVHVKLFHNTRLAATAAWGPPKVTLESDNGTERVFRFHAGFGTANVWWRGGGPHTTINCPILDDIYVKVRPGF